eukprot:TRINITY_DN12127_c0_g1_i1.p1 TRINITY_DN12127_c0_g1~~TRINITY_DN12127_c0_g1_i1.p1  ORF type:complete len:186 (-),score=40.17 TRINITY_DN12127_c0_g1_i1:58-615(-)
MSEVPKVYTFRTVDLDWEKPIRELRAERKSGKLRTKEEKWQNIYDTAKFFAFAGFLFGSIKIGFKGVQQASFYTVTRRALTGNYKRTAIETANTIFKPTFLFTSIGFTFSYFENYFMELRQKNDQWNGVYSSLPVSAVYYAINRKNFFPVLGLSLVGSYFFDDVTSPALTHEQKRLDAYKIKHEN